MAPQRLPTSSSILTCLHLLLEWARTTSFPAFFSNGTIGAGGVANEVAITSFYDASPASKGAWNDASLTYTHVPERIPEQV